MSNQASRSRRLDILPYLKRGDQIIIARLARCHPSTVSAVLNGRASQTSELAIDIIAEAKEMAQRNNPYKYKR